MSIALTFQKIILCKKALNLNSIDDDRERGNKLKIMITLQIIA